MTPELEAAAKAWCAGADLRQRRQRYKSYTYGDQWCDMVRDAKGRLIREDEQIRGSGGKAMSNNLIRQLVKTVVGRYRTQAAEAGAYEGAIAAIAEANALAELDARLLEEFLISGCAIQRVVDERRWAGTGIWIDNVDPRTFFVNNFRDPRGHDIDLIGMLHDMSLAEIINRFSHGNTDVAARLRHIYSSNVSDYSITGDLGKSRDATDFFSSSTPGRCRAVEVWSFDATQSKGDTEARLEFCWHCRWFAPDGTLLDEYDSPFAHGAHPFAVRLYPLTDGEVHPFVEDVIDQQRYINRLIVMIDRIMTTSAKGVLLFPVDQMVDSMSWSDITNVWAQSDGVIPISGQGQQLPQQVITNTSGSGAYQLLEMQLKLFEDISGVGDALLGRTHGTARGVEMFDTQIRNATIALADIFETFTSFARARNEKALSTR